MPDRRPQAKSACRMPEPRYVTVPESAPALRLYGIPRTATFHAQRPRCRANGIDDLIRRERTTPVQAPLVYAPQHIIQTPGVRQVGANARRGVRRADVLRWRGRRARNMPIVQLAACKRPKAVRNNGCVPRFGITSIVVTRPRAGPAGKLPLGVRRKIEKDTRPGAHRRKMAILRYAVCRGRIAVRPLAPGPLLLPRKSSYDTLSTGRTIQSGEATENHDGFTMPNICHWACVTGKMPR